MGSTIRSSITKQYLVWFEIFFFLESKWCCVSGSVKEAEEFDKLSPEESKRRLGILLTKMDLNNDNQIDRNELHAWILRSFRMLSEEEAKERFEDTDSNSDGAITWAEYLSDYYGVDQEEDVLPKPEGEEEEQVLKTYYLIKYL